MKELNNLSNKKIAIYGGSFNPIHIGHLLTGFDIIEKLGYEHIIYIPANIPVHKDSSGFPEPSHRLKMLNLSIKYTKFFLSSDIEIKRGGLTYTYDTVEELTKLLNYKAKFGVVFGDDLLAGLNKWKNIDSLQNICELICLKRDLSTKENIPYKITYLKNRVFSISSTEIRERVKSNLSIDYMVTKEVKNYIVRKKLYRV
ncbi:MAG: nicotinate (nicotinamide) nucleotide adenylyltransferase [Spirochaetes bacterium GWD1_27_9]|nr:MAG: nicotinate (nicotinamide) nucleotide adenylyltransferase [Spirochaetes bacterium GWB1_27_13]OHD27495.1 MAG: nicotinate (nicotinamide) nucleotide adenylyltransferase [Spirochaetes bacterium GWC1_27_15]OHD41690.1 MAG: nicotinate (nicotinamide) nucleotide adenylyltransferase [Spirochaetes bacterium GWD1_27_9]